jgi:hypothetical protein
METYLHLILQEIDVVHNFKILLRAGRKMGKGKSRKWESQQQHIYGVTMKSSRGKQFEFFIHSFP